VVSFTNGNLPREYLNTNALAVLELISTALLTTEKVWKAESVIDSAYSYRAALIKECYVQVIMSIV
jgi:hypothetical protein